MDKMKETVREYLEERGWDELDPADLSKSIVMEAAEPLEEFRKGQRHLLFE